MQLKIVPESKRDAKIENRMRKALRMAKKCWQDEGFNIFTGVRENTANPAIAILATKIFDFLE